MPVASETLGEVLAVMASTFGCDESELSFETAQVNCGRWTSLYHMMLVLALEERFGLTLSMGDTIAMTSVKGILAVLSRQLVGMPL